MRISLLTIVSIFLTAFIYSCNSSDAGKKAINEKVADVIEEIENVADVPIPELYKGMAESPNNKLGGLKVGDVAPNIVATLSSGATFDLNSELKAGPIAVIFYRGFWCPKCTRHLEALQGEMAELKERGLRIYAVTPEKDEYIAKTKEKSTIEIPFIHDQAHKIMDAYKVTYKVTDEYEEGLGGFAGVGLAESHGATDAYLPVPATYLIGQDGKIIYAHYNHDYGKRASASNMLAALNSI